MSSPRTLKEVEIAENASLSNALDLPSGGSAVAVLIPATWTAAVITFQISINGNDFYNYYFEDAEYTIDPIVAGTVIGLDPAKLVGATAIKIRSGTSGAPVVQLVSAKVVEVVIRGY